MLLFLAHIISERNGLYIIYIYTYFYSYDRKSSGKNLMHFYRYKTLDLLSFLDS